MIFPKTVIRRNPDGSITCPECGDPIELRIYDMTPNKKQYNDIGVCSNNSCALEVEVITERCVPNKLNKKRGENGET